jgi:small subunit ribosomal protein S1
VQGQPWQEFAQNTKRGDRVKGPIKSITDFGVFVGLAAGIDGLVHLSDLSWNEPAKPPCATTRRARKSKPSCWPSTSSASASPWASSSSTATRSPPSSVNDKGQIVTGKVKTVDAVAPRSTWATTSGLPARLRNLRDRVEDARNVLKEGDEVTAVVVNVDRKTRNIQLSIKAKDPPTSRKPWPA